MGRNPLDFQFINCSADMLRALLADDDRRARRMKWAIAVLVAVLVALLVVIYYLCVR